MRALRCAVLVLILVALGPAVATAAFRPPSCTFEVLNTKPVPPGEPRPELALERIAARVRVTGTLVDAELTQDFANPFTEAIEAVYSFPLPPDAAVIAMRMEIGERVVRAEIQERETARRTYEEAKDAGKSAALVEQVRPDIFTQAVANILPGQRVRVVVQYVHRVARVVGGYELTLPTTIGPRFLPPEQVTDGGHEAAEALAGPRQVGGTALRLDVQVHLADAGVRDLNSFTHRICHENRTDGSTDVRLAAAASPDGDFRLSWKLAGDEPRMEVHADHDGRRGFFMVHVEPPREGAPVRPGPRELFFVVDTSGSMAGAPMKASRDAIAKCLAEARPEDTLQVVRFSDDATTFRPRPVPATPENCAEAVRYVENLEISGGTFIVTAVQATLALPPDPERQRIVAFFTDGFIGNESQVLQELRANLHRARVFCFGVGSAPNRALMEDMARVGRGVADYVPLGQDPRPVVERFHRVLTAPVLSHLALAVDGVTIHDVSPASMPDLYGDRPLELLGRYQRGGPCTFRFTGRIGGKPWELDLPVDLPDHATPLPAIRTSWARSRLTELTDRGQDANRDEITRTGVEFHLVTPFTSLVAVEERVVRDGPGRARRVRVPSMLPSGMSAAPAVGTVHAAPEPGEWVLLCIAATTLFVLMRREEAPV